MKDKILKIATSNALEAYDVAPDNFKPTLEKLFGIEVFQKDPKKLFNVFDDILKFHKRSSADFQKWCEGLRPHEIGNRKEEMIVAAYNGRQLDDPLPDFTDGQDKYYPRFVMGSPSGFGFSYDDFVGWHSDSVVGARQVFTGPEAYENLVDATKKFIPEYKESRTL